LDEVFEEHYLEMLRENGVRSSESYSEKWNYVRKNPLWAGLVPKAKDWPYVGEIFALEYRSGK